MRTTAEVMLVGKQLCCRSHEVLELFEARLNVTEGTLNAPKGRIHGRDLGLDNEKIRRNA